MSNLSQFLGIGSIDSLPVGSVIRTLPDFQDPNYYPADGSEISRALYPKLSNAVAIQSHDIVYRGRVFNGINNTSSNIYIRLE